MDWLDLLAVQGTLKSLLQHHSSKASILQRSALFTAQLSQPYMTTGKTIALTRRTFVLKVMSLLLNMLSRLVITFLPRSKSLLISWLQSPSAVIFKPKKVPLEPASCPGPHFLQGPLGYFMCPGPHTSFCSCSCPLLLLLQSNGPPGSSRKAAALAQKPRMPCMTALLRAR